MRQGQRAGNGNAPLSFVLAISCLASLYVLSRLWASSSEVAYWRKEVYSLTLLADEQRLLLDRAEGRQAASQDVLFFSVRPAAHGALPALPGPALDDDDLGIGDSGVIASLDNVEAGVASGWACMRDSPTAAPLQILLYVDGVLAAKTAAAKPTLLPAGALARCRLTAGTGERLPLGFAAELPPLPQGTHELRAFAHSTGSTQKQELGHSPLLFRESTVHPDAQEAIRRKDAIIVRRNAELVALWNEVKTQVPWKRAAEAAGGELAQTPPLTGSQGSSSGGSRLLAAVLVHTDPGSSTLRRAVRRTWLPTGASAAAMEEALGVATRFVVGASPKGAPRGGLAAEAAEFEDMLQLGEDSGEEQGPAQLILEGLAAAAAALDADFYVVTRDSVAVDPAALASYLSERRSRGNLYAGCMRSGQVVTNDGGRWYERDHARFGDPVDGKLQYPRHSAAEFFVLSRAVALYLVRNRAALHRYANGDTSVGAWLVGLEVEHVDDRRMCCDAARPCATGVSPSVACMAYYEATCNGVCKAEEKLPALYDQCIRPGRAAERRAAR